MKKKDLNKVMEREVRQMVGVNDDAVWEKVRQVLVNPERLPIEELQIGAIPDFKELPLLSSDLSTHEASPADDDQSLDAHPPRSTARSGTTKRD